jgi:peptidoglycan/LPS O-acetylase OafA/YrhL
LLPNLDALRAFAVLLVLADHVLETLASLDGGSFHPFDRSLGRLGVLLFFVHTCFVLMASLERGSDAGWALARTFYVRRVFRIYPLAIVCVLAVVAAAVPARPWEAFRFPDLYDLASNLLLVTNLTVSPEVLAPLWSLPVELQMYLLLPLVFAVARSRDPARVGALYLLALGAAILLPRLSPRFGMIAYAPCFLAGVVGFVMTGRFPARMPAWAWMPFLGALAIVFVVLETAAGGHHVLMQAAVCLAVGVAIPAFAQSTHVAFNRATHAIAKYSYGIYLFHLPALWLAFYGLPLESRLAQSLVAVVTLATLAIGGYHLIEAPLIRSGARWAQRPAPAAIREARVAPPGSRRSPRPRDR